MYVRFRPGLRFPRDPRRRAVHGRPRRSRGDVPHRRRRDGHDRRRRHGDHDDRAATTRPASTGLEPETEYPLRSTAPRRRDLLPGRVSTLAAPRGALLATFATVNDVHFGEVECGRLGTPEELGPILSSEPGDEPYPEVMNAGAIAEIAGARSRRGPREGRPHRPRDRRGVPGVPRRVLAARRAHAPRARQPRRDGQRPDRGRTRRTRSSSRASRSRCSTRSGPASSTAASPATSSSGSTSSRPRRPTPVLVFGHHHPWDPSSTERNDHYFGINPDDSEALCAVIARRESIARILRRSHAPQPRAPLRRGARRPDRRDRVREGLSRARGPSTACTRAATRS